MNDAESKFKSLQEDKLWVTSDPMKAKMLVLTTMIGKLTRQLDLKRDVKQSDKPIGNFPPSIGAWGNNEKYDQPKPGESLTKMFGKQMKYYCSKCRRGKCFWGWHEEKSHGNIFAPKQQDNSWKRKNGRTPQLQLDSDMKKALNTLTGRMVDVTDAYEPDF